MQLLKMFDLWTIVVLRNGWKYGSNCRGVHPELFISLEGCKEYQIQILPVLIALEKYRMLIAMTAIRIVRYCWRCVICTIIQETFAILKPCNYVDVP